MSGMNCLLGIATDDYIILSGDKNAFAHGAITMTDGNFFCKKFCIFRFKKGN